MKYIYCITTGDLGNSLNDLRGINEAPVTVFDKDGLVCVMSDIDEADKTLDRVAAMAHQNVLEKVMEQSTILPLAFGHIVPAIEEVEQKLLEPHLDSLREAIEHLDGNAELNLKAFWPDLMSVLKSISEESDEIKRIKKKSRVTRDDQIRAGEIAAKTLEQKRNDFAKLVVDRIGEVMLEYKEDKLFGDSMIANIAFLVPKTELEVFDEKVNACAEHFGDQVHFKSIGPVPPYNFTNLKITV
jgi:hypothetical protein